MSYVSWATSRPRRRSTSDAERPEDSATGYPNSDVSDGERRAGHKSSSTFARFVPHLIAARQNTVPSGLPSAASTANERHSSTAPHSGTRTMKFNVGANVTALAMNSDNDRVALAGRERSYYITEDLNLGTSTKLNTSFASNDVKWGLGETKNIIASAAGNGQILLWNIGKSTVNKLEKSLKEHKRAVNSIAFNPANGRWLLSASQDGTIKFWDIKDSSSSRATLYGKAEGVRDVQFSPRDGVQFAAAFDNGTVQVWDLRTRSVLRTFHAHNGPALTIDWHQDGKRLASGGRDKIIKVWDTLAETRRPKAVIYNSAPVSTVAWRPLQSIGRRGQMNMEIASSSLTYDKRIMVWDLKRPYVASRILEEHDAVVSGFLWKDESTVWSCSKDKVFIQHDVSFASQQINSLPFCAVGWNPRGGVGFALGERQQLRNQVRFERVPSSDEVDERRKQSRSASFKSVSYSSLHFPVLDGPIDTYKPNQVCGTVDLGGIDAAAFTFLAQTYQSAPAEGISLIDACEHNSRAAWAIRKYRDAQTWKIIATVLSWEQNPDRDAPFIKQLSPKASIRSHLLRSERSPMSEGYTPRARGLNSPSATQSPNTLRSSRLITSLKLPSSVIREVNEESDGNNAPDSALQSGSPAQTEKIGVPISTPASEMGVFFKSPSEEVSRPTQIPHSDKDTNAIEDQPSLSSFSGFSSPSIDKSPPSSDEHKRNAVGEPVENAFRQPKEGGKLSSSYGTSMATGDSDEDDDFEEELLCQPLVEDESDVSKPAQWETDSKAPKPWNVATLAHRVGEYYSEQGDTQMCAVMAALLGQKSGIPTRVVDEWTASYIENLQRHGLFVEATEIINIATLPSIREQGQKDTMVHVGCQSCGKPITSTAEHPGFFYCEKCAAATNICILCRMPVNRSWILCQGCMHGGHDRCLREWFVDHDGQDCPSGCGCTCMK